MSHISLTSSPPNHYVSFSYSNWPSGTLRRTVTVTVEAWHSTYSTVKVNKSVVIEEVDCSEWADGHYNPIDFGSEMLNSQTHSAWLYEIDFGDTTPDQCKNSA